MSDPHLQSLSSIALEETCRQQLTPRAQDMIHLNINVETAWIIIGFMQLALKHQSYIGTINHAVAGEFTRRLIDVVARTPEQHEAIRRGWEGR